MVSCRGLLVLFAFFGAPAASTDPLDEEWLRNEVLQQNEKLYRLYKTADKVHNYHYDRAAVCKAKAAGHVFKNTVGYVVTPKMYQEVFKDECPELVETSIWRITPTNGNPTWTYISCIPPRWTGAKLQGKFYCAEKMGYCGANQPFYELNTYYEYDMVYTDDIREAQSYKRNPTKVCYLWVTQQSHDPQMNGTAVRQRLIESKSLLHRVGLVEPNGDHNINRLSISKNESNAMMPWSNWMFQFRDTVAYVVKECDWQDWANIACPDLILVNVTQAFTGSRRTFLTEWGKQVPPGCPSPSFYCSPYRGYCGADKPILSIKSSDDVNRDVNYPSSEWEADNRICMDSRYEAKFTVHCYGWAEEEYYKKAC